MARTCSASGRKGRSMLKATTMACWASGVAVTGPACHTARCWSRRAGKLQQRAEAAVTWRQLGKRPLGQPKLRAHARQASEFLGRDADAVGPRSAGCHPQGVVRRCAAGKARLLSLFRMPRAFSGRVIPVIRHSVWRSARSDQGHRCGAPQGQIKVIGVALRKVRSRSDVAVTAHRAKPH
jgi:hypothetical protein